MVNESKQEQEPKLSGAFISVLIVGLFIVGSWLAIYFLFLSR
ncbi:cytochrome c oxidase subunit 2A [Halalkalibacillus sediminis]|uniref:Cytochrome c oxidase subunit 2A n=1 Tax=Halalkalibacillus sediminis TaxID=2018042 RepID=A0A2I0QT65_9BACI|nr:cytochrome c oxidase subunit 2A [Halalkalibacillus sediminis]